MDNGAMPQLKRAPSVMRFHFRNLLVLGLPFAAAGAGFVYFLDKGHPAVGVALGLIGFAIAGVGLFRQERNFRRMECPGCHRKLSRAPGKPGERISFVCLPCDTEWDSGFQESSDRDW